MCKPILFQLLSGLHPEGPLPEDALLDSSVEVVMEGQQQGEGGEKSGGVETVEYTIEDMDTSPIDIEGNDELNVGDDLLSDVSKSASVTVMQGNPNSRENITAFAEKYSISQASKRFKVAPSTIKKWLKVEDIQMRPKFNSPGQGRKITYSKETDDKLAGHIRGLLAKGEKVTLQYMCNYAKTLIQEENAQFNASTGWAQRFLLRHGIDLGNQRPKRGSAVTKTEAHSPSEFLARGRPLSYSHETDQAIAGFVRDKQSEGHIITNSELRKHARELITKETPNFTGSASWAQNFLLRHKLALHPDGKEPLSSTPSQLPPPTTAELVTSQSPTNLSSSIMDTPLEPAAEMTPASAPPVYATMTDSSVAGLEPSVDDPMMKTALAILTGENIDSTILSSAQAAALQSTLSELTSDTVSLVDLLNNAQQLQEHIAEGGATLITHGLDSSTAGIYLGLPTSEAFGTGLTGPAATQVNPNTQAPTTLLPRLAGMQAEQETGQASRPLSYTKETDQALANWVQEQQAVGKKVTFASLRAYAKKLISSENPNFNASVGWVTPFLLRHNLDLSINQKKKQPRKGTPRKIETPDEAEERMLDVVDIAGHEMSAQFAAEALAQAIITTQSMNASGTHPTTAIPEEQGLHGTTLVAADPMQLSELQQQPLPAGTPTPQAAQEGGTEAKSETAPSEQKFTPGKRPPKSQRVRHTLSEKLEVVRLMKEYNSAAHFVCRMLGIANSTLAGWIKLVQHKGEELEALSTNKKRANVSGQGRPLSYSKEKDEAIARWVRSQQEIGIQVSPADLAKYATSLIGEENVNFTASSGWQQKFLQRHSLQLWQKSGQHGADKAQTPQTPQPPVVEDQQSIPAPVQTEEVVTHEFSTNAFEKPYSDEIDRQLAQWAREKVKENGSLSVQTLCRHAEELVVEQNPMFMATLGWAFKFLHRHQILLDPKPSISLVDTGIVSRKHSAESTPEQSYLNTPKKLRPASLQTQDVSVSPSTGNLCEALLALSNQAQEGGGENSQTVQAAVSAVQSAMQALQQQQSSPTPASAATEDQSSPGSTYFGKPAREFSPEEKEEVVRYANATTLQKAALKYGVAAPTVWRWRVELKLHQPKYTPMQKRYIIKFAETNCLKEAAQRYGITSKTIQNWRKSFQAEGELPMGAVLEEPSAALSQEVQGEAIETPAGKGDGTSEVVTYDNQNFQFIVDGGEVVDTNGNRTEQATTPMAPVPLEVTTEMDIENVGMEYDVISSEGHAAKPRCTPKEKLQILQYALDHSVKEASLKFGISPGTVYYWKKSMSGNPTGGSPSQTPTSTTNATSSSTISATAEPAVSVQYSGMSGNGSLLQTLASSSAGSESTTVPTGLAEQFSGGGMEVVQSLANLPPEALRSLPAEINLLHAVTSLLSNADAEGDAAQGQKSGGMAQRHDSNSGGISSPTDVLVPPFQAPPSTSNPEQHPDLSAVREQPAEETTQEPQIVSSEEVVPIAETSEITVSTSEDTTTQLQPLVSEGVAQVATTCEDITVGEPSHDPDQPTVGENIEVNMAATSQASGGVDNEAATEVASILRTVESHTASGTESPPNPILQSTD